MSKQEISLYVHIPFCVRRCTYCDFNTYSGLNDFIPEYVRFLCEEIRWMGSVCSHPVHTIFLGGGTPSILEVTQVRQIIHTIKDSFHLVDPVEITLEANPGTLDRTYLQELVEVGINRLSLGMQAAYPEDLQILGRIHEFRDVIDSVTWARALGIRNISLDLIFGIPGQMYQRWIDTLNYALALQPDHISLYSLTIEEGTLFSNWWKRGLLTVVTDDDAADCYLGAQEVLYSKGYRPYEISNWVKWDETGSIRYCRHNMQYWRNLEYIGFGAGAHSYFNGRRFHNVLGVKEYIIQMRNAAPLISISPAAEGVVDIDRWTEMEETMMLGLRLIEEGVDLNRFYERFQTTPMDVFSEQIRSLIQRGLLEVVHNKQNSIRLTSRGILLGNQVFLEFIGNQPPTGY